MDDVLHRLIFLGFLFTSGFDYLDPAVVCSLLSLWLVCVSLAG